LLGWIGFGVPDWQTFQRYNGSATEYYGLWAYCQQPPPLYSTICKRWHTAGRQIFNGSRPNFVSTADGLITTGMIFVSFGFIAAVFSALLPLLAYLAGVLTFIAFIFLVVGLPIFGNQANNLSKLMKDVSYHKRYGFWLIVPTIVLSFLAALLFLGAGFLYQKFGFGNFATHSYSRRPYGGQQLLGPAYAIRAMPYGMVPRIANPYPYPYPGFIGLQQQPSLLSQYIAQRMPRYSGPVAVRRIDIGALPQPSVMTVVGQPIYVTPSYYRAPLVNLTGTTLVGPVVRYA
jgi:hypothetical protein